VVSSSKTNLDLISNSACGAGFPVLLENLERCVVFNLFRGLSKKPKQIREENSEYMSEFNLFVANISSVELLRKRRLGLWN
jgi:hypothetical protein